MKRLLLLSNSTNYGESYLSYPKQSIKEFLGPDVSEVLFIPYAGVSISYDDYTLKVAEPFLEMGYNLRGVHSFQNAVEAVGSAQALAIGGGNTFELLNQLYENGLIEIIRERVFNGMPFMGWSAGSNVAGPTIKTSNDMPIVEPHSFNALDLVPFQINPHYTEERLPNHGGESRPDRIMEFIELNPGVSVVGIPEGNLLKVIGKTVSLVGPGTMKVFHKGLETKAFSSQNELDFLLK